jgi:nucleoside-diphosphate-sugar epimerase
MLEHMYGPNDNPNKFIEIVSQNMHNKIDKMDLTLGYQKRDFIHVDDVCDLVVSIISKISTFKIKNYNFEVGNGKSSSIRDFLTTMKIIFNSNIKLNFGGIEENEFEINDSFSNINTIPSQLNWKPKISIDKGIKSLKIN